MDAIPVDTMTARADGCEGAGVASDETAVSAGVASDETAAPASAGVRPEIWNLDRVVERLRVAMESQMELTLQKHQDELLSNIRTLMKPIEERGYLRHVLTNKTSFRHNLLEPGEAMAAANEGLSESGKRTKTSLRDEELSEDMLDIVMEDEGFTPRPGKTKKNMSLLQRILSSHLFEIAMGTAVFSNSIFIGVEVDHMSRHPDKLAPPLIIIIISYFYTVLFAVELVFRLVAGWREFLWKSDMEVLCWNYLDVIIVGASLVEVALDIAAFYGSQSGSINVSNLRIIRIVRVFRLTRLLRISRLVRFVRAMRVLVYSLLWSLKSFFWAIVLMTTIMYVFAILLTQAVTSHRSMHSDNPKPSGLERFWGTIGDSMFSLFMSVSGGISWVEVIDPLSALGPVYRYIFVGYIGFTVFVALNVMTGVFCQAAIEGQDADHDSMMATFRRHKKLYTSKFKSLFDNLDEDKSGRITLDEFLARMNNEDVQDYFASLELSCGDALCMFDLFEDASTHGVRIDEFVLGCLRMRGNARSSDMVRLLHEHEQLLDHLDRILVHLQINAQHREAGVIDYNVFTDKTLQDVATGTLSICPRPANSQKTRGVVCKDNSANLSHKELTHDL